MHVMYVAATAPHVILVHHMTLVVYVAETACHVQAVTESQTREVLMIVAVSVVVTVHHVQAVME